MFGLSAVATLTFLFAASLALNAVWELLSASRMRAPAEGAVTGWEANGEGCDPIVEFVGADGTRGRFVARSDGYLDLGQTVPIAYRASAPHRARVATPMGTWVRPVGMLVLAAVVATWTSTSVERASSAPPEGRVAAYDALNRSLDPLERCASWSCAAPAMQRRLRAYDRARLAAAPLASERVGARIAEVQRSLVRVRRDQRRPRLAPILELRLALHRDLQEIVTSKPAP